MDLLAMQSQLAIEWSMKLREAAELYPGRSWLGAHSTHAFDWTALPLTWYVCAFYVLSKPVFHTLEHEPITLNSNTDTQVTQTKFSYVQNIGLKPWYLLSTAPMNTKHKTCSSIHALIQHVTVKPCVYHLHCNS